MKTTTSITLDPEILFEAKKRKLNMSAIINDFLRNYLNIPNEEIPKDLDIHEIDLEKAKCLEKIRELEVKEKKWKKEHGYGRVVV